MTDLLNSANYKQRNMNLEHWTSKEYLTFVLLHMANADDDVSIPELYHLASRQGPDRVIGMRAYMDTLDEKQRLKLISRNRDRFYPGAFGRSSLISEIIELCHADGDFSNIEKELLAKLETIL